MVNNTQHEKLIFALKVEEIVSISINTVKADVLLKTIVI